MKILSNKRVRLDELIQHIWETGIVNRKFYNTSGIPVKVDSEGFIKIQDPQDKNDTYLISDEYELTSDTVIKELHVIYWDSTQKAFGSGIYFNLSIRDILEELNEGVTGFAIAALSKEKEPVTVWRIDEGIPRHAVLEVD